MIKLTRIGSFSDRTLGVLKLYGTLMTTLERPWLANRRNVSCIPAGAYEAVLRDITRFGRTNKKFGNKVRYVVEVMNVPDRSGILLHPLNYPHQTQGCIGVGWGFADSSGSTVITDSTNAINSLNDRLIEIYTLDRPFPFLVEYA